MEPVHDVESCRRELERVLRSEAFASAGRLSQFLRYIELGEIDQAFRCLDRAVELRDSWLLFLKVSPAWDRLRADPRFETYVKRVGLH